MEEGDYDAHFALKNMFKDAQFALKLANTAGLELLCWTPRCRPTSGATPGAEHRSAFPVHRAGRPGSVIELRPHVTLS